ncbi:MAG: hypothetical protein NTW87_15785 [Planctomycetota bacterium]|nr:hypothetical protein [Planctomycetota bacterium]
MRVERWWLLPAVAALCVVRAPGSEDELVPPLRQFILDTVKGGAASSELPPPFGRVRVLSGNDEGLVVQQSDGGKLDLKWTQLAAKDIYKLGRGLLQEGDVEGHLKVARLAIKLGLGEEMDKALERLELAKPQAYSQIERVRSLIGPQEPPPKAAPAARPDGKPNDAGSKPPDAGVAQKAAGGDSGRGVNQEGRKLPPLPQIAQPVLFDTPEADAILAAMQVFPPSNPWNEDISKHAVHPNSATIIASIGAGRRIGWNSDMGFVLVPPNQPKVGVKLTTYSGESDKGPYPMPDNAPVEGWPMCGGPLDNIQRNGDGDRHVIVVDPCSSMLYEFYMGRKTDAGWEAANEATCTQASNKTRPYGWTSSDAAGLPIFPSVARYDECERGMVEHALRVTVRRTRKAYVWPATHYASRNTSPDVPAMGQRLRLKADVDVSKMPKHAQAIAKAMKKYGMFVADNGMAWLISVAPDKRITGLDALRTLKGSDFEVVETTPPEQVPGAK